MTNQTNIPNETPQAGFPATPVKTSRRKWLIGGAAGLAALMGIGTYSAVQADGGWGGHRHGWHRGMDPANMGKRVDFGVDLILGRVQASDEQKTKVTATIKGILGQAPEFRRGHEEAREQLFKLLKADTFDKAAIEKLRAERVKAIDEASKKVAQALYDVADTLTPKQRQELLAFAEKRRGMFGHGRRH